jgi:phenylacetate-CoA ligase
MGRVRRVVWRTVSGRLGPVEQNLAFLRSAQFLPIDRSVELQRERLKAVLLHAKRSVPYYSGLLGKHNVFDGDGEVDLDAFSKLPFLDKRVLKAEFENLKSTDLPRRSWHVDASGGSTGTPTKYVHDRMFEAWALATKHLFDEWTGFRFGERKIILWGSSRDIDGSASPFRTRLARWLRNERYLRAFGIGSSDMVGHARAIDGFRPVQVLAYAEIVYELSREILSRNMSIRPPRAVMTSAGVLYPAMRRAIEAAFRAPVFDRYGSREVGDIGCECERHAGLHIVAPCLYVEVVRPDGTPAGPGEDGEIVVTTLANYAMPLIRYRIGDIGAWAAAPCACGRSWPSLAHVSGRTCDVFITEAGTRISGLYFVHQLRNKEWIGSFRLIQQTVDDVDVLIEPASPEAPIDQASVDDIRSLIRTALGDRCRVNIEIVDQIEPLPSGKNMYVISKVGGLDEARGR